MERLSDKNPCNTCTIDRQIGNPYRWQCECDRCQKPDNWKDECIEKLKQYEKIGTVEEIRSKMEELARWHSDRLNSRIKNEFAAMSTLICHNCDHKDEYIEELETEVEEYRAIGTVEECQLERERLIPKKAIIGKVFKTMGYYQCPICGGLLMQDEKFCNDCGQRTGWKNDLSDSRPKEPIHGA